MKHPRTLRWVALAGLTAALAAGCKPPAGGDDGPDPGHADHSHTPANASLPPGVQGETSSGGQAWCAEHGVAEAECAVCHPEKAAALQPGESLKVRLPSTNSIVLLGRWRTRSSALPN
jgi:hypothetical protein